MIFALQFGGELVVGILILTGLVGGVLVWKERRKRLAAFYASRAELPIVPKTGQFLLLDNHNVVKNK